jgi:hypothetical protein
MPKDSFPVNTLLLVSLRVAPPTSNRSDWADRYIRVADGEQPQVIFTLLPTSPLQPGVQQDAWVVAGYPSASCGAVGDDVSVELIYNHDFQTVPPTASSQSAANIVRSWSSLSALPPSVQEIVGADSNFFKGGSIKIFWIKIRQDII